MALRPRQNPPRTRSADRTVALESGLPRVPQALGVTDQTDGTDGNTGQPDLQAGLDELMRDFDAALAETHGLDKAEQDHVRQIFADALADAAANPGISEMPDRSAWIETVESLQHLGAVDADEANHLVRQLDDALQPLQSTESRLAIEFSRRMQQDGEEAALAWLRETKSGNQAAAAVMGNGTPNDLMLPPMGSEVVNSRSRRLRGPPRR